MTPDPRIEQVAAALARLPLTEDARANLPREAYALAMTAGFATLNDRREAINTRQTDGVSKEADTIGEAAFATYIAIRASHRDTRAAFGSSAEKCDLYVLEDSLLQIMRAAVQVSDNPSYKKGPTMGRPTSRAASMIADFVLEHFETATGMRATIITRHDKRGNPAEGPFLDLLASVFDIFRVQASAETQGKKAINRKKAGEEPGGEGGMVTIRKVKV